jgi:hypothetical protein
MMGGQRAAQFFSAHFFPLTTVSSADSNSSQTSKNARFTDSIRARASGQKTNVLWYNLSSRQ